MDDWDDDVQIGEAPENRGDRGEEEGHAQRCA